ncbi:hypothetical protein [Phormidesmis priestleyi]
MPISVLTDDFRQQLAQQRDRLIHERSAIVQAVVDQVTADLDRTLDSINELLDESPMTPSTPGTNHRSIKATSAHPVSAPTPSKRVTQKRAATASASASPQPSGLPSSKLSPKGKSTKAKPAPKTSESKPKLTSEKNPFDAPNLKREFQDLTPAKAMEQVMVASPDQTFTTDEMIDVLFGSLEDTVLPRTRQSVALMFSHGMRRQDYIKAQEDPTQYKLNPETGAETA